MNPPTTFQPAFPYIDPSLLIINYSDEAHQPYGISSAPFSTFPSQSTTVGLEPSPPFPIHNSYDAESNTPAVSAPSMLPPAGRRKKKAPTLRDKDWEPHKDRIKLLIEEGLTVDMIKERMEKEWKFVAEKRQYRLRITKWGLDKNIKKREMKAIVRKTQQRKINEPTERPLLAILRGKHVEPQKITRWMKEHNVLESDLYEPGSAGSTPSAVCCRTISECGSITMVPSPAFSLASPILSPTYTNPMVQGSRSFSPALSISSIVSPQSSSFAGQSPALAYRSLQSFMPNSFSSPNAFQGQEVRYRYRQAEEERLKAELSIPEYLFGVNCFEKRLQLGEIFRDQGRYKAAEEIVRKLVEGCRTTLGEEDIDTLRACELLGRILHHQGLYSKAERLFRRTLASRKVILGDEHPATLTSMGSLALTVRAQGRWKEAEELGVQMVETQKRVLGEEHPDTLTSMGNLGSTYISQGRWKEAEKLQIQVLESRKGVLGEDHPRTLLRMGDLAETYRRQGRWKEAEGLGGQVLESAKRVLGEEHPDTLRTMYTLTLTLWDQSRKFEAFQLMEKCISGYKRVLGPQHPHTLGSLQALNMWRMENMMSS